MAVPSSGQLRLRADIALEVDGSDTGTNVSLGTLADTAGFDTPPDQMSEFYGYSAFTDPSITAQVSFSSVTASQIRVQFSYSNPNGGTVSLESGVYFGTSSNKTSNTFYSFSTSSATTRDAANTFTGLSSNTTYYCWGVVRDTESPARFTELTTNSASQATEYDYQFKGISYYVNYQNINTSDTFYMRSYYQHINGSYTTKTTANSTSGFVVTGLNGAPQLQFSQNRNNRVNLAFTNVANGCTGTGYGQTLNASSGGSYPNDTSITFSNFSTLWSTDCRSGYSGTWQLQSLDRAMTMNAYKETGHEFGAQFTI